MPRIKLKKNTAMSHVIVDIARKTGLSSITNHRYPCRMSLTIFSPMSSVEFKKRPGRLSLGFPCCLSTGQF